MNRQLERQLEVLKDKIQKHNGANKRDMVVLKNMEEMSDVCTIDYYVMFVIEVGYFLFSVST